MAVTGRAARDRRYLWTGVAVAILRDVRLVTGLRRHLRSFAQESRSTYISQDLMQLISLLRLVRFTSTGIHNFPEYSNYAFWAKKIAC